MKKRYKVRIVYEVYDTENYREQESYLRREEAEARTKQLNASKIHFD
jgi:hypothetical protein